MRNDLFNFRINKELKEYLQKRANEQNIPMARYLKNLIKKDMKERTGDTK